MWRTQSLSVLAIELRLDAEQLGLARRPVAARRRRTGSGRSPRGRPPAASSIRCWLSRSCWSALISCASLRTRSVMSTIAPIAPRGAPAASRSGTACASHVGGWPARPAPAVPSAARSPCGAARCSGCSASPVACVAVPQPGHQALAATAPNRAAIAELLVTSGIAVLREGQCHRTAVEQGLELVGRGLHLLARGDVAILRGGQRLAQIGHLAHADRAPMRRSCPWTTGPAAVPDGERRSMRNTGRASRTAAPAAAGSTAWYIATSSGAAGSATADAPAGHWHLVPCAVSEAALEQSVRWVPALRALRGGDGIGRQPLPDETLGRQGARDHHAVAVVQAHEAICWRRRALQQRLPGREVDPGADHVAQPALLQHRHRDRGGELRRSRAASGRTPSAAVPIQHAAELGLVAPDIRSGRQALATSGRPSRPAPGLRRRSGTRRASCGASAGCRATGASNSLLSVFASNVVCAMIASASIDEASSRSTFCAVAAAVRSKVGPHARALRHEVVVDAIAHQRDERHRGDQHDGRQVGAQRGLGPQRGQAFPQRGRRRAAQWGMPLNAGHMHVLATGTAARRRALPRPRGDAGADLPMGSRRGTQPPRAMRMDEDMLAAALRAPGSSLAIALD